MFKRHSVSLMNSDWEVIVPNLKVKHIPRTGELIYLELYEVYYNVTNVIHNINKNHGIFVIVEIFEKKN